jgi:hypothetical protein
MKKSISAIAAVLLVMTASVGTFRATAFADENQGDTSSNVSSSAQANQLQSDSITLSNLLGGGQHNEDKDNHGHSDNGKHKGTDKNKHPGAKDDQGDNNQGDDNKDGAKPPAPGPKAGNNAAAVAALHAALDQFHKDQAAARAQHERLVDAANAYIRVMQSAVVAGDIQAVDTGMKQTSTILATLNQALAAQSQADSSTQASTTAQTHGDLQTAIDRIKAADAKLVAKTQAMQAAADALNALVKQLQAEVAADGAQNSGSTASGSTSNSTSTGTDGSGNVTVTVTGSGNVNSTESTNSTTNGTN